MDHRGKTEQLGPMKSYCISACFWPGQGDGGLDLGSDSENEKCSESLHGSQIILARLADPQEVGWEGERVSADLGGLFCSRHPFPLAQCQEHSGLRDSKDW